MTEYRFEFKYLLSPAAAQRAERFIHYAGLNTDPTVPCGSYVVTSLYFDNAVESDYYDKSGGFLKRVKVRARTYEPVLNDRSQNVWLELKQRHDAAIKKIRIELRSEEWDTLLKKGASALWLGIDAGRRAGIAPVIWELVGGVRRPKTFVRYLRRAYLGYTGGERIRLTFDSNL